MNYQDKISGHVTSIEIPKPRPQSRERWRDAGNGMIECEKTGRRVPLVAARSVLLHEVRKERSMQFTEAEWVKLEALAVHRSTRKHKYTPQDCVHDMIKACVTEPQWVHPTEVVAVKEMPTKAAATG